MHAGACVVQSVESNVCLVYLSNRHMEEFDLERVKMSNFDKSKKNVIFSLGAQLLSMCVGILLPRVILVGYGSEVNGLLNSVTQIIAYMAIFEAGIQSVATKALYATIARDDKPATNSILSAVHRSYRRIGTAYSVALFFLAMVYALFASVQTLSYGEVWLIVFFSGLANVVAFFRHAKYRILLVTDGKEYILIILNTITTITNNALKILLLSQNVDVCLVVIITFCTSLIQVFFIERHIQRHYQWIDLQVKPDLDALKQNKHVFIHQIAGLIFFNIDVLLLTLFCDLKAVSVYSVYKLIIGHISSFVSIPYKSSSFALGQQFTLNRDRFYSLFSGVQVLYCSLVFSILTVTYFLMPFFISLYTKGIQDIAYCDPYLPFLFVFAELLNLLRVPPSHVVGNCAGHFKETLPQTIAETLINLFVSIVGVIMLGIYGVLLGTIVALFYRTLDFAIYVYKRILMKSVKRTLLLYGVNLLLSVIAICFLQVLPIQINSYIDFAIYGVIVSVPMIVIFTCVNYLSFRNEMQVAVQLVLTRIQRKLSSVNKEQSK